MQVGALIKVYTGAQADVRVQSKGHEWTLTAVFTHQPSHKGVGGYEGISEIF